MAQPFRRHGLISTSLAARSALAHGSFLLRGANHERMERMRVFLAEMVAGWEVSTVTTIIEQSLDPVLLPLAHAEALELIRWHREFGRDVVLVSSSAQELVGPLGERLGATMALGTRMRVAEGRYTNEIERYVYGPAKAEILRELAEERGYDLGHSYGYSDSITDVPMLSAVGRPHAVNPDRALREHAERHGWPILEFAAPERGGRARPPAARPTVAAAGALAAATTVGLGWYLARRRR